MNFIGNWLGNDGTVLKFLIFITDPVILVACSILLKSDTIIAVIDDNDLEWF